MDKLVVKEETLRQNAVSSDLSGRVMPIYQPAPEPLFSQRNLDTLLRDQIHKMEDAVDEIHDDPFLQYSPSDLIDVISQNAHVPPLELHVDRGFSHQPREIKRTIVYGSTVPINGFIYTLEVPYSGSSGLFNHQPAAYESEKPTAKLNSEYNCGSISITRAATVDVSKTDLSASFEAELNKIRKYIALQALQLDPFNASLKLEAARIVHDRRDRLLMARDIAASLGYPLYHRGDAPLTYISPQVRRNLPTIVSAPGAFRPEPTIAEVEYQNIIRIIENMSFVMERNPRVFSTAPEETIRDHYLVQLNGQYEGSATGETFNGHGRTDIIVRDGNFNLFIAECKIWGGQKLFTDTIDQLLGYVTWRDTKTSVIIFNRNKDTTKVVDNIKIAVEAHTHYKRDAILEGPTKLRAVFGAPNDPVKDVIITIIVVPIPTSGYKKKP